MAKVLYDGEFAKNADWEKAIYFMHREVHKAADEKIFTEHKRRYDVTVIPPFCLGSEFVKTAGHYHELASLSAHLSFPELYEVLHGTAHFLIFRRKALAGVDDDKSLDDCILIEAEAGEKIFVPPNYGHVMTNPASETLATANLVEWKFKSLYEPIGNLGGGPYFELCDGKTVPNKNYKELPPLKKIGAKEHEPTASLGLDPERTVYDSFAESPEKFGFLEP
jgi:glucose-6-phosphate isomerase